MWKRESFYLMYFVFGGQIAATVAERLGCLVCGAFDHAVLSGADPPLSLAPQCVQWLRRGAWEASLADMRLDDAQRRQREDFLATHRTFAVQLADALPR
jgi:hypothetical protein